MASWEYKTLAIEIVQRRNTAKEANAPWFSLHFPEQDVGEETSADFATLGNQGWELVSVVPLDPGGIVAGTRGAIAFFKRPQQ